MNYNIIIPCIAIIYTGVNCFLAGLYLGQNPNWATDTKRDKINNWFICLYLIGFGLFFIVAVLLFRLVKKPIKWVDSYFQIRVWYYLYFTKRLNNLPSHRLDSINHDALINRSSNSVRNRIYRRALTIVNERNNYVHNHADDDS